jgi:arsenical pump membrane protein
MLALTIFAITCLTMILGILFQPEIRLGRVRVGSYWVVTSVGAVVLLLIPGIVDFGRLGTFISDFSLPVNPVKILSLFLSMTMLSIYLDEQGFFRYLANAALRRAGKDQKRLFAFLYVTVSVLTVFTSNDIIILSVTPFICYFAKTARINPVPYLAAEFVAANTWSMALVIGNPTNIYLATANEIGFATYARTMMVPTLCAGAAAYALLRFFWGRSLNEPMSGTADDIRITDRGRLLLGLAHLAGCTAILAASSLVGWEMWKISCFAVLSLFVCDAVLCVFRRERPRAAVACLRRAPWALVPFVLSMFVMIAVLGQHGIPAKMASILGRISPLADYGIASFLSSNLINNIPMSVLFCSVVDAAPDGVNSLAAVYATIVGSNLGALFSPIGALAGIMWGTIIGRHDVSFGYLDFIRMGFVIGVPSLAVTLAALSLFV